MVDDGVLTAAAFPLLRFARGRGEMGERRVGGVAVSMVLKIAHAGERSSLAW